LVVDDEADVRFVLRRAFEGAGQEVIEAVHGADAVARIGEAKPDLGERAPRRVAEWLSVRLSRVSALEWRHRLSRPGRAVAHQRLMACLLLASLRFTSQHT
jgi:CheY-like chemotaxis protein